MENTSSARPRITCPQKKEKQKKEKERRKRNTPSCPCQTFLAPSFPEEFGAPNVPRMGQNNPVQALSLFSSSRTAAQCSDLHMERLYLALTACCDGLTLARGSESLYTRCPKPDILPALPVLRTPSTDLGDAVDRPDLAQRLQAQPAQ